MANVANYKGHVEIPPGMVYGPDTCGASYIATDVEHYLDKDLNPWSTVQFKPYMGDIVRGI